MIIGAVNGKYEMQPGQVGKGASDDPVAKGIQDKIAMAQKELKELSANKEMNPEQKQKKRQELQQEISDLNMQLRQHQMEQKQKERQEKMQSMDELMGNGEGQSGIGKPCTAANTGNSTGFSAVAMEALISADGARKAASLQGNVAARMEGRANTLEAEIQLDAARGGSTERKEAEMASMREKAQEAQISQMKTLGEANDKLEEARQSADADGSVTEESADAAESITEKNTDTMNGQSEAYKNKAAEQTSQDKKTGEERADDGYQPVDVRI